MYAPQKVKAQGMNFMCAEQVFAWLSRFKRILCSMPKTDHLFFCIVLSGEEISTQNYASVLEGSLYFQGAKKTFLLLNNELIYIYATIMLL